jgi:hypothetical protein
MQTTRARRNTTSTHSWPRHYMGVSGLSHDPVAPRFTPGERTTGTHWTRGWVGPRAGLDTEARGKIILPLPGIEPRSPGSPARSQPLYWLSEIPGSLCSQTLGGKHKKMMFNKQSMRELIGFIQLVRGLCETVFNISPNLVIRCIINYHGVPITWPYLKPCEWVMRPWVWKRSSAYTTSRFEQNW